MNYHELADRIENQIDHGLYKANDRLPSEIKQAEHYKVSLNTVKKAMLVLIDRGYIRSIRQSGYYVNNPLIRKGYGMLGLKSLNAIAFQETITTKIHTFEIINPPMELIRHLNITPEQKVFKIFRSRYINDVLTIYQEIYMPQKLFADITEENIQTSIYEYVNSKYNIYHNVKNISATILTSNELTQLGLPNLTHNPQPLLKIENTGFLDDGTIYEYSINYHFDDEMTITATKNK